MPNHGTPHAAVALLRRLVGAGGAGGAPRTLLLVAHPDDETIGAGGLLVRLGPAVTVAYVTDGAPRDPRDARAAGCATREAYAALRRRERAAALAHAGVSEAQVHDFGVADQGAWRDLAGLARRVAALAAEVGAELVLTHPYEGGHPDHDACAFAARAACDLLAAAGTAAPALAEFTSYHADPHAPNGLAGGVFRAAGGAEEEVVLALGAAARARKAAMYASHASQAGVLAALPPGAEERFRPAPRYDFTRPPPGGAAWYERYGWDVDAAAVAGAAAAALGALVPAPRPLTVVSVAYALAPVRADAAGGAEQVLGAVDRALVAAGHRSVVVAMAGSRVAGTLAAVPAPPSKQMIDDAVRAAQQGRVRATLAATLADLACAGTPADLVHFHGIDVADVIGAAALDGRPLPALVTLHLPPAWYPEVVWSLGRANGPRPGTWLHCVSAAQHRACRPAARLLPPVPNGVAVPAEPPVARRRGYALCLGRVCPEKGYHLAAEAAVRAGVPLLVAGQLYPYEAHVRYWEDALRPRMGRGRARFIGTVDPARKRRLLAGARCLVVPSLADETSSLVAMEAAAAGTPVVAFRRGALPEVVEHGRTGWLADDVEGLADGIRRAGAIDPGACWATARARFDEGQMTAAYLTLYETLYERARYGVLAAAARVT